MPDTPIPIEIWDIERLVPYTKNAKLHPEEHVAKLAASIRQFGWTQPIIVWTDGSIIAGHGRRLAALSLGMKKVPVVVRSDLTKIQADTLRLADNKVASTQYDEGLFAESMREIIDQLPDESEFDGLYDIFETRDVDFFRSDMGEMDDSHFADDIGAAVAEQAERNKEALKETDETVAPIGDAFGFKRVSIQESRQIRGFMEKIEASTGLQGPSALIEFMRITLEADE